MPCKGLFALCSLRESSIKLWTFIIGLKSVLSIIPSPVSHKPKMNNNIPSNQTHKSGLTGKGLLNVITSLGTNGLIMCAPFCQGPSL